MDIAFTPQRLLVRLACIALAALLLVSAWSNREFWTVFPFSLQTLIDIASAFFLFICAFSFDSLARTHKTPLRVGVGLVSLYIVLTQAIALYAYVQVLGVPYITEQNGSFMQFILNALLIDVGVPLILLSLFFFAVYRETGIAPLV